MAKKTGKDFSIKKREHIIPQAKAAANLEDHVERMDATQKLIKSYHDNEHQIIKEHRAYELALLKPSKPGSKEETPYLKLFGLYEKIDKEHEKGELPPNSIEDHLKQFANIIMPSMMNLEPKGGKLTPDMETHNINSLKFYLNTYDSKNQRKVGTTYLQIKDMIAKGHGHRASALMIQVIMEVKKQHEFEDFLDTLFPAGKGKKGDKHYDFMLKASEKIAKTVNEKSKLDYEVTPGLIGHDRNQFVSFYRHYAKGEYDEIKKMAKDLAQQNTE
ncbi:hypothetical protein JW707_01005 [Candidatus Woesearchaeota archaeon]|nr:hypothetical protein [Candidatus Woesearchaeota archaeon]